MGHEKCLQITKNTEEGQYNNTEVSKSFQSQSQKGGGNGSREGRGMTEKTKKIRRDQREQCLVGRRNEKKTEYQELRKKQSST